MSHNIGYSALVNLTLLKSQKEQQDKYISSLEILRSLSLELNKAITNEYTEWHAQVALATLTVLIKRPEYKNEIRLSHFTLNYSRIRNSGHDNAHVLNQKKLPRS